MRHGFKFEFKFIIGFFLLAIFSIFQDLAILSQDEYPSLWFSAPQLWYALKDIINNKLFSLVLYTMHIISANAIDTNCIFQLKFD